MHSEFGGLVDEPSLTRYSPRNGVGMRGHTTKDRAHGAVEEWSEIAIAAAGAAVGDDLLADQQRLTSIRRILVALEASLHEDFGVGLDSSSRAGFECLMRYNSTLNQPMLGAESTGRLVATWLSGSECLTIRFMDRFNLQFAFSSTTPEGPSRIWGAAHSLTFLAEYPEAKRLASR